MKPWRHTKWKTQHWIYMDGSSRRGVGPDAQLDSNPFSKEIQQKWDEEQSVWTVTELNPKTHIAWEESASQENKMAQQLAFRNKYINKQLLSKHSSSQKTDKPVFSPWKSQFSYHQLPFLPF